MPKVGVADEPEESTRDAANELHETSAERVAHNDAAFREANEEIRARQAEWRSGE